ncbi:MAG: hypothetical protein AABX03_01005 [Nanoarchaeota archaeon]
MSFKKRGKKGQVTIFVIVAIVIIAGVILFFALTDYGKGIIKNISGGDVDFNSEIRNCIEDNKQINSEIKLIMKQGGSLTPSNYFLFNDTKISYLCYSNEYYKSCVMQNPNLMGNTENEIERSIRDDIQGCFNKVEEDLKSRGYSVNKGGLNFSVDIIPKRILIKINYPFNFQKGETSSRYENFNFQIKSSVYQLMSISTSILNYEARYGDSESLAYMALYPQIRVNKLKQSDSSTLYLVSDRNTNDVFWFAVRSYAWPAGYKL